MKVYAIAAFALIMAVSTVSAASEKDKAPETAEGELKIYKRLIPADVLRGKFKAKKQKKKITTNKSLQLRSMVTVG